MAPRFSGEFRTMTSKNFLVAFVGRAVTELDLSVRIGDIQRSDKVFGFCRCCRRRSQMKHLWFRYTRLGLRDPTLPLADLARLLRCEVCGNADHNHFVVLFNEPSASASLRMSE